MKATDCKQPPRADGKERNCSTDYCLCRALSDAAARCVARGEGWRWGLADQWPGRSVQEKAGGGEQTDPLRP